MTNQNGNHNEDEGYNVYQVKNYSIKYLGY